MQTVILFACFLVFHVLAEVSTDLKPEFDEESSINNHFEEVNIKKEKFSYLLNLLKSAITAEENNTNIKTIIETESNEVKDNILERNYNPKEEFEIIDVNTENETAIFGKTFDKIMSKISTAIEKPAVKEKPALSKAAKIDQPAKINKLAKMDKPAEIDKPVNIDKSAIDQPKNKSQNLEMPSMIPIFKPKSKIESKKYYETPKFIPRQSTKTSKPFDQADLNFKYKPTQFNIPCQRAADVLEMNLLEKSPKHQPNLNSIACTTNSNIQKQGSKPVTISANCKDLDESVRMEFKPKAISLMQLYGNILRKLTITVLVPYHIKISKLKT